MLASKASAEMPARTIDGGRLGLGVLAEVMDHSESRLEAEGSRAFQPAPARTIVERPERCCTLMQRVCVDLALDIRHHRRQQRQQRHMSVGHRLDAQAGLVSTEKSS